MRVLQVCIGVLLVAGHWFPLGFDVGVGVLFVVVGVSGLLRRGVRRSVDNSSTNIEDDRLAAMLSVVAPTPPRGRTLGH